MVGYSLTTSQIQQVVTGQGGRMCTFRTDRTKRDTDTGLEHKRDTDTPRETQTHGSNTKRDNTDIEEGHRHRQIQGLTVRVIYDQYMRVILR